MQPRRTFDRVAVALLSMAVFVLGHEILYLLAGGPGYRSLLQQSGHGPAWDLTAFMVVAAAALLTGFALRRLVALAYRVRVEEAGPAAHEPLPLLEAVLRLWLVLLVVALALFVANENLERLAGGLPLPGIGVVGGAGPIFAGLSLAVALVAGLYGWQRDLLVARLAAARPRWRPSPPNRRRLPWVNRRPGSNVGRRQAGRAPPSVAFAR